MPITNRLSVTKQDRHVHGTCPLCSANITAPNAVTIIFGPNLCEDCDEYGLDCDDCWYEGPDSLRATAHYEQRGHPNNQFFWPRVDQIITPDVDTTDTTFTNINDLYAVRCNACNRNIVGGGFTCP